MSVILRKLQIGDYDKGFIDVLGQLTSVKGTTKERFEKRFLENQSNSNHRTFVGEKDGKIVCTATLLIENKYLRGCKNCGHIEDVAVDSSMRRTGIGKKLITHLIEDAKQSNCYKVILDCSDKNIPFYESCGMSKKENEMAIYFE